MLACSAMGGFNGFSHRDYEQLTDREVCQLLGAEFDSEGRLLLEHELHPERFGGSGSVRAVMRELPEPTSIGLTDELIAEAQAVNPHVRQPYLFMFWQVAHKRGLTPAQTMERWQKKVGHGRPPPARGRGGRQRRRPLPREEGESHAARTDRQDSDGDRLENRRQVRGGAEDPGL